MKICIAKKSEDFRWERGGEEIKYRKTNIKVSQNKNKRYYALSFTFNFDKSED